MNRGDGVAALEGLVGNHDHHHGQLVSLHMYVCTYVRIYYVYSPPDIAYICVYCQVIEI